MQPESTGGVNRWARLQMVAGMRDLQLDLKTILVWRGSNADHQEGFRAQDLTDDVRCRIGFQEDGLVVRSQVIQDRLPDTGLWMIRI